MPKEREREKKAYQRHANIGEFSRRNRNAILGDVFDGVKGVNVHAQASLVLQAGYVLIVVDVYLQVKSCKHTASGNNFELN